MYTIPKVEQTENLNEFKCKYFKLNTNFFQFTCPPCVSRMAKQKAKKHESFDVSGSGAGGGLMVPQNQVRRHSTGNPVEESAAVAAAAAAFKRKRGSAADIRGGEQQQQQQQQQQQAGSNGNRGAFMRRANKSAAANLGAHPQHPHAFVHTHSESQIQPPGGRGRGGGGGYDNDPGHPSAEQMLSAPQGLGGARGRRGSCPKIAAAVAGSRNGSSEDLDGRDWQNNIRRKLGDEACKLTRYFGKYFRIAPVRRIGATLPRIAKV